MGSIGIIGGTFNPIHIGHLIAAQECYFKLSLDKIVFIPTGTPPHKTGTDVLPANDRYKMVQLSIQNNACFEASSMEINREGNTYTYDTLIEINKKYPNKKLFFIIGFDTLEQMDSWYNIQEVFDLANFVVVNRGNGTEDLLREIDSKKCIYGVDILNIEIPNISISSTEIRRRVKNNESIKYLVHEEVEKYILDRGFYR